MVAYVPIVLGTATLNAIIVGLLYLPLMKVLKKEVPIKASDDTAEKPVVEASAEKNE